MLNGCFAWRALLCKSVTAPLLHFFPVLTTRLMRVPEGRTEEALGLLEITFPLAIFFDLMLDTVPRLHAWEVSALVAAESFRPTTVGTTQKDVLGTVGVGVGVGVAGMLACLTIIGATMLIL